MRGLVRKLAGGPFAVLFVRDRNRRSGRYLTIIFRDIRAP
jgi:hypothetical protein